MSRAVPGITAVLRNRDLGRVAVSYACFISVGYATWIAMLVYAFDQGGATTAGLVALAQLIPAALFAPYAGVLADRRSPAGVLVAGYLLQAAALAAVAGSLLLGGGAPLVSYAFAAVAATAATITRPAQAVLVPELARQPEELTAFNVIAGWIESACILVAPALTGVVLGVSTPGTVFAICAGLAVAAGIALVGLVRGTSHRADRRGPALVDTIAELMAGFRAVGAAPPMRVLVLLLGAQYVVIGAFDVLAVVLAIDVLDLGASGAGYLNAAYGAGGVIGAAATVALIGRRRLAPSLLAGAGLMGASLVVLGARPTVLGAFVLLAGMGAGPNRPRCLGPHTAPARRPGGRSVAHLRPARGCGDGRGALGSILAPALMAVSGASAALVVSGALLPVLALLRLRTLVGVDAAATVPIVELSLLRSLNIFAPLPAPVLEGLARSLVRERFPAAHIVMREGEPGHDFYAVADGEIEITARGRRLGIRRRCEGFGEIALLRDSPRTATAVARTDALLYRLDKEHFLAAVTGHSGATHAAERLVRDRLATVTAATSEAETSPAVPGSARRQRLGSHRASWEHALADTDPAREHQRSDGPLDGATLERLASSCGGGAEGWAFVRELIDTFLEEAPAQLATLRNAVEQAEAKEARLAAHTLKSNGATFGASSFTDVCRELEAASTRGELGGDAATALVEQAELEWERARDALARVGPG